MCQALKHESDKAKIEFRSGMAECSFKVFDQTLTPFHPSIGAFNNPTGCHWNALQFFLEPLFRLGKVWVRAGSGS